MMTFVDKQGVTMLRDWAGIWLTSAAIAGLTMIGFALFFPREVPPEEGGG